MKEFSGWVLKEVRESRGWKNILLEKVGAKKNKGQVRSCYRGKVVKVVGNGKKNVLHLAHNGERWANGSETGIAFMLLGEKAMSEIERMVR
jgi:hypothetical protein